MEQLYHPFFRFLVFSFVAALLAVMFALHAHAADIPAYDGGSQTPGQNAPGSEKEVPVDRPNIEQTALLPWVADTAGQVWTLGPEDYQETLKKAAEKFTKSGWKDITGILARNKIIDQVSKENLYVTIMPGTPILLSEDVKEGVYQWIVTMPATISYTKDKENHNELTTINVTVVRVPLKENVLGIQIDSWTQT
jgi:hypothetical protein